MRFASVRALIMMHSVRSLASGRLVVVSTLLGVALLLPAGCSDDAGSGGLDSGSGDDAGGQPDDTGASDTPVPDVTPDALPDAATDAQPDTPEPCVDVDGDGYGDGCDAGPDCNDESARVNPGVNEICGDGFDNNCDGEADEGCDCVEGSVRRCYGGEADVRGIGVCVDGVQTCEDGAWSTCNHGEPSDEVCDLVDNDCDGDVDEEVANACGTCGSVAREVCGDLLDNDCNGAVDDVEGCTCDGRSGQPCYTGPPPTLGYGVCRGGASVCEGDVFAACVGEVLPSPEICDRLDNDCDGLVDEGLANACGQCGVPTPTEVCDGIDNDCDGLVDEGLTNLCGTCGATDDEEICGDGVDNNCDGRIDEDCACNDGETACWPGRLDQRGVGTCSDGERSCDPSGEVWGPCEGARLPGVEVCDGLDNDCDGLTDIGTNGCSVCSTDVEVCDGVDNDCDGQIDELLLNPCGQCIDDVRPEESCGPLCCDGIDNDCDGLIDEGLLNVCGSCDEPCFEHTWGDDADEWEEGVLDGLDVDGDGALRLGSARDGLPYLWVANSGEATVSRINTETIVEEARFPVGQSPSRTAVDFDGNVFVANRAFFGQGTVSRVDADDCSGDECVAFTAPVGPNDAVPRGIAIDADGFVWVGTYNDRSLRKLDPVTGVVIEEHFVGRRVYGIAIDSEGVIWFSNLEVPEFVGGSLGAFDTETRELIGTWEVPGCSNPYGIAVDGVGNVWLGNFTCNNLVRFDRRTREFTTYSNELFERTRGVAVDGDGYVWIASYGTNRVGRFDPASETFVGTYPVCDGPIGIGIANDDHIWVPCYGTDNVYRLSPEGEFAGEVAVGRDPYSYSDLTGFQLRNFTARRGTWNVTWDCEDVGCIWNEVRYDGDIPAETEVLIRARVSPDGSAWSAWAGPFVGNPADLGSLPPTRFIELEVSLRTSNVALTPSIDDITVAWSLP